MSKYRSREAPPRGASVSETHPGFWTDHINHVRLIEDKWYKDYGHIYYEKKDSRSASAGERPTHGHGTAEHGAPRDRQVSPSEPVAYLRSRLKEGPHWDGTVPRSSGDETSAGIYTDSKVPGPADGEYGHPYTCECSSLHEHSKGSQEEDCKCGRPGTSAYGSPYARQKITEPWHNSGEDPKKACDYSTPGNTQQHHIIKDPVTSYSSSFGHHSYQFNRQNPANQRETSHSPNCPRQHDKYHYSDTSHWTHCPHEHDNYNFPSSSSDPDLKAYKHEDVNLSLMAQNSASGSWGEPFRKSNSLCDLADDPECCPKCRHSIACVCVPRRREKVPGKRGKGPEDLMPAWPPQLWVGPSYSDDRPPSHGDILRLRYRLNRDPESKTSMNRMYDEIKRGKYYDGKVCHSGPNSFFCPCCHVAHDAQRGTWLNEQLRKGNPFTTGDTQSKSCSYSPGFNSKI